MWSLVRLPAPVREDILSILEASKEIGKARAASSGNFLRYATLVATVQALAFVCLEMLNLTVGSAARLKFEAVGYFQPGCGYLVNADHLDGWQCPNPWNLPVDFLAVVLGHIWGATLGKRQSLRGVGKKGL